MIRTIRSNRFSITEVNLNIQENLKYGMMLSGGIDSAMLLYIILDEHRKLGWTPNIQPFVILKKNETVGASVAMINYINTQFEYKLPMPIEVGDPNINHRSQGDAAWKEIARKYPDIDYVFYASNRVPDWNYDSWPKGKDGLPIGRPQRSNGEGGIVWLPFLNLYKFQTIDLVYQYGQEKIFELARSCTQVLTGPRCGTCFHCKERAWGFSCVGKTDPGIG